MTAIDDRIQFLLAKGLTLGPPLTPEQPLGDGGAMRVFEHGRVYFHPRVGKAFEVIGRILVKYIELGEALGELGYPTTGEVDSLAVVGGRMSLFEQGRLEWAEDTDVTHIPGLGEQFVLRKDDRGTEVNSLQEALQRAGRYAGDLDGIYGTQTQSAVKSLQSAHGLTVDGIAGEQVWVKLRDLGVLRPPAPDPPYVPGAVTIELLPDADVLFDVVAGAIEAVSPTQDVSALNAVLATLEDLQVTLSSDLSDQAIAFLDEIADEAGLPRLADTYDLLFAPSVDPAFVAGALAELTDLVASATPHHFAAPTAQGDSFLGTSDQLDYKFPDGYNQWYFYRCKADAAATLSNGNGVVVAVIDAGFLLHPTDPDLRQDDIANRVEAAHVEHMVTSDNAVWVSKEVAHGTATMAVAGASSGPLNLKGIRGFAPECTLWAYAVQDMSPSVNANLIRDAIYKIIAANDPRPIVISISMGRQITEKPPFSLTLESISEVSTAIAKALKAGIPVVISAGNEGNNIDLDVDGVTVIADTGCIVVGGTDPKPGNPRWNTSAGFASNHGARINVCAPSVHLNLPRAKPDLYGPVHGTSYATPMVSGTVALMRSIHPKLTPAEIRSILTAAGPGAGTSSAEKIGTFLDAGAATTEAFKRLKASFGQSKWRWCSKCQILFFGGGGAVGACPAGGSHDASTSPDYVMIQGVTPGFSQEQWKWCKHCQALFFAGAASVCPKGGPHDGSASGLYSLPIFPPPAVGEAGWRWCRKCGCTAWAESGPQPCYAGADHDTAASGHYHVMHN